jgi:hypothetical protein
MKIWPSRRRVALAASHFLVSCVGIGAFLFLAQRERLGSGSPLAALGLAWAATTEVGPRKPDFGLWTRTLVAGRAGLGEDDFAVEAAFTLALLRQHAGQGITDGERRALQDAAARCPSVLHAPCDDERFDQAAARRLNPPKTPLTLRDAGSPLRGGTSPDADSE